MKTVDGSSQFANGVSQLIFLSNLWQIGKTAKNWAVSMTGGETSVEKAAAPVFRAPSHASSFEVSPIPRVPGNVSLNQTVATVLPAAFRADQCLAGCFRSASSARLGGPDGLGSAGARPGSSSSAGSFFSQASEYAGYLWSSLPSSTTVMAGLGALGLVYAFYKYYSPSGVNVTQTNNNHQTLNLKLELPPGVELVRKTGPDGEIQLSVRQAKADERFARILKEALQEHAATLQSAPPAA